MEEKARVWSDQQIERTILKLISLEMKLEREKLIKKLKEVVHEKRKLLPEEILASKIAGLSTRIQFLDDEKVH